MLSQRVQIKICERCFLCHSIVLCKTCNKCRKCYLKSACRGKTSKLLANLAESGYRSESSSNPERGVHPPLSDPAKTHQFSNCHKLLCQSPPEQLPAGGITSAYRQKCSRACRQSKISGIFQPTIPSAQTQQQVEKYTRSEQIKVFPKVEKIQNGDTGNHQDVPPTRGVGDLNRFQGRLLSHSNTGTIQEISEISCPGSDLPIQSTAIRFVHNTHGVHCNSKGGEADSHTQGYKNPPVPRRLFGESQIPPNLSPAYTRSSEKVSGFGLAGEFRKVTTGAQTSLQFCRLPVWPQVRSGPTYTGPVAEPSRENTCTAIPLACPVRQFISMIGLLTATEKQVHLGRLHMRPIQWHLKSN